MKKKMKNLFEDRLKVVQERTKIDTSYMGGSCLSLRAMEGHRVVLEEVYMAQNRSKVNANSKSGSCLSLRAMGEHRGVVVKTNVDENRGKYEFVECEHEEAVNQPTVSKIVVVNYVVAQCEAVKFTVGEDTLWPLSLDKDTVMKDSSKYSKKLEVLAELARSSLSFLLPKQMKYEVDKRKGVEKHNMMAGLKKEVEKKDKLEDCSHGRCRRAALGCVIPPFL
jgi:hypothetical protein